MKSIFRSILVGLLALAVEPSLAGNTSSGGGDPLRFHFLEGKEEAFSVANQIDLKFIPEDAPKEVVKWLLENRIVLAEEIKNIEIEWMEVGPFETCARTRYVRGAVINLSFAKCRGMITSKGEAAKLLLHEASHHLGIINETMADQIALVAFRGWEIRKQKQLVLCPHENKVSNNFVGHWEIDYTLTLRLLGMKPEEALAEKKENIVMTYEKDDSILTGYEGIGRCVYLAGYASERNVATGELVGKAPFILADVNGMPRLYYGSPKEMKMGDTSMEVSIFNPKEGLPTPGRQTLILTAKALTPGSNDEYSFAMVRK